MKFIQPVTISGAMLVSSTVAEDEYPAWVAGAHAALERVIRPGLHAVYQCDVAVTSSMPPESDPDHWQRVGPTKRWAMFDGATGTATTATGSMVVVVDPGLVDTLALLDVDGNSVTVRMHVAGVEVFSRTVNLNSGIGVTDAYSYCFTPIIMRRTVVISDLPPYASGRITITVNGSGAVGIGTAAFGQAFYMGEALYGVSLSLLDYSGNTTDSFGVTTVVERDAANKMTVPFVIEAWRGDEVMRRLKAIRATPVVVIGSEKFDSTVVFGLVKDAQTLIKYALRWECSATVQGLT
jgi:hypothetical protein